MLLSQKKKFRSGLKTWSAKGQSGRGRKRASWLLHEPARTFSSCKIFPTKSSWGVILGLKGKTTGQNNNDTTWNPSSPPTPCFPPGCREPLLEATATVPCLSIPSSWIGVNSSEVHTLSNQLI